MLKVGDQFAVENDLKFNSGKSVAIRIGARYLAICEPRKLAGNSLRFVDSLKCLGVCVPADKHFKCSLKIETLS